jgi:hypothetical protein
MLNYYQDIWLRDRDPLNTLWLEGRPQTEVRFKIPLPASVVGHSNAFYCGTLDRVIEDAYGDLWILDYKSYKAIQTMNLEIDPQISAYCWAGQLIYNRPIQGLILVQHRKETPNWPKLLRNGNLSVDQRQKTSYEYYLASIIKVYGDRSKAPERVLEYLEQLRSLEELEANPFIRRDYVIRSQSNIEMESIKILAESADMLDPELILYPTPTRDCSWDCPFYGPCTSLDDGGDPDIVLRNMARGRLAYEEEDGWRRHLRLPLQPEQGWPQDPRAQRRLRKQEQDLALDKLRLGVRSGLGPEAHLNPPQEVEVLLEEPDPPELRPQHPRPQLLPRPQQVSLPQLLGHSP